MAKGQFVSAGSDLGHRNWPTGPYRYASMFSRRRGKEVGSSVEFCYPKEQYDAFNTQRNEAQSRMMVLAPEMAELILEYERNAKDIKNGNTFKVMHQIFDLADKLKAIDNGRMRWVAMEKGTGNVDFVGDDRDSVFDWIEANKTENTTYFVNHIFCLGTETDD